MRSTAEAEAVWEVPRRMNPDGNAVEGKKMAEYKVMLVDDEEDVIRVIMQKIAWKDLGFEVIGYAHNGVEALEIAEAGQPDVVMTDIKMPYMDGLELAHRLREMNPAVKILFFTGFDEFEYAKEAIRVEAEEYILKPVNAEELTKIFSRIRENLDRELDERRNVEKLRDYYMESLPLLQENFYASLIEGTIRGPEISGYLEDYRIDLTGPLYVILVIHTSSTEVPDGVSPLLLSMAVRRLARERLSGKWRGKFFSYLGNTVMIAQLGREGENMELTDECDRFCRLAKHMNHALVTIGIGRICSRLSDLPSSYTGAREAISYRVLYGTGQAINITEIAPQEKAAPEMDSRYAVDDILKKIKMDSREALGEAVDAFMAQALQTPYSIQRYDFCMMEMIGGLYRLCISSLLDPSEYLGGRFNAYDNVRRFDSVQMRNWIFNVCTALQEALTKNRTTSRLSMVEKAVEYVDAHYSDHDLTIDRICGELGLSAAYFSTVFKRETGRTFINYLTDRRMEEASRLLTETEEKTYVIARKIGYEDPNYFSYVFKKTFGKSPTKYRADAAGSR